MDGTGLQSYLRKIYRIARSLIFRKNNSRKIHNFGNVYTKVQNRQVISNICKALPMSLDSIQLSESSKSSSTTTGSYKSDKALKAKKILIVDDSFSFRKVLRKWLEKDGHSCEEAQSGRASIDRLRKENRYLRECDVILMNLIMPGMDGHEATKQIRELGYTGSVIGLSSSLFTQDIECFLNAGATYVLIKPFTMEELNVVLDAL